ncbi:MAG: aminoacyl-tRNA hydrolase [Chloroflexi bacterium]|nr:MAG: aminoacyl-tRNA hydrolase [Chloroflexota bacterium]
MTRFAKLFGRGAAPPRVDRVVVGLGNPGDGYAATRHNVGFQVASRLAKRARADFAVKAADSRIAEGAVDGVRVAIARPQTFMNDSGRAVRKLLDRYRIQPSDLLVVFDEVDLPLGKIRLREKGGPGTHNGMRSIVSAIGEDFPRLRVGVAPVDPRAEIRDLVEYVLTPFDATERDVAETSITRATEAAELALREGIQPAMAKFNG